MNINVDAETLATIKAQLEKELKSKPTNAIDKAFESAEEIRQNIRAIKGEAYLKAVDFGILINKAVHINAALSSMIIEIEPKSEVVVKVAGHAHSSMMASLVNDYCDALGLLEDTHNFARELTEWIDRVFNAEQSGVKSMLKKD
jgi:hypothetical protein